MRKIVTAFKHFTPFIDTELAVTASEISIDVSGNDHNEFLIFLSAVNAGNLCNYGMRLNGDTGSKYERHRLGGTSVMAAARGMVTNMPITGADGSGGRSFMQCMIIDAQAGQFTSLRVWSAQQIATGSMIAGSFLRNFQYNDKAELTNILLRSSAVNSYGAGTRLIIKRRSKKWVG